MIKFSRESFHPRNKIINSLEIQQLLNDLFLKKFELNNFKINDVSSKKNILNNSVLFLDKSSENKFYKKKNLLIITNNTEIFNNRLNHNLILVNNLSKSYNLIVNNLFFHDDCIDFEDDYYIYIATPNGFNLYNKSQGNVKRYFKQRSSSLLSNNINSIIRISETDLLIATNKEINMFNTSSKKFSKTLIAEGKNVSHLFKINSDKYCFIAKGKLYFFDLRIHNIHFVFV